MIRKTGNVRLTCNNGARSRNHSRRETAISITHSECVFEAFVIQHAMRMRRIAICGLFSCTIFFTHYFINGTIFGGMLFTINQLFTSAQHLLLSILGLHVSTDHSVIFRSLICYKFQGTVHTFGIPIVFTLKLNPFISVGG